MLALFLALFLSFVPALIFAFIVYWLDRYEKEPLPLLGGVFIWGAVVATIGALIIEVILEFATGQVTGSRAIASQIGSSIYAPVVEESLKGFAVLLVFIIFFSEFDDLMDGLVYAGIVALGFAATENVLYLWSASDAGGIRAMLGLWVIRVVLDGWAHPLYTAFIGMGLAMARLSRGISPKLLWPLIGWVAAVVIHSLFNTVAGWNIVLALCIDWAGWILIAVLIVLILRREGRWIAAHLREEVEHGTISAAQYRTACSTWLQSRARLGALADGRYRATARFYQLCGELAQKKQQLATLGEERGNTHRIEQLRAELARLAPMAGA